MAYIDSDYVDEIIGAPLRQAIFTDEGVYNAAAFSRAVARATARVRGALEGAGYTPPTDAELTSMLAGSDAQVGDAENIRAATLGMLMMFRRKQWGTNDVGLREELYLVKKIETGELAFSTLALDEGAAVGGAEFSENDPETVTGIDPIFSRTMGR